MPGSIGCGAKAEPKVPRPLNSASSPKIGAYAAPTFQRDGNKLIEFPTEAGKWYRVRYSQDMVNWYDSPVPLQAGANRMQWIDSGPPFTQSPPSSVPSRFYIVNEITAP